MLKEPFEVFKSFKISNKPTLETIQIYSLWLSILRFNLEPSESIVTVKSYFVSKRLNFIDNNTRGQALPAGTQNVIYVYSWLKSVTRHHSFES